MREFSESERSIIKHLATHTTVAPFPMSQLIAKCTNDTIAVKTTSITHVEENSYIKEIGHLFDVYTRKDTFAETCLLELIFLFDELERAHWIVISENFEAKSVEINPNFDKTNFIPNMAGTGNPLLLRYVKSDILVRYPLINFVKNDFKTDGQVRFCKQQWVTWIGIIIALLIGIVSIFN